MPTCPKHAFHGTAPCSASRHLHVPVPMTREPRAPRQGNIFIDANSRCFEVMLDYLRQDVLALPRGSNEYARLSLLKATAERFGMPGLVERVDLKLSTMEGA